MAHSVESLEEAASRLVADDRAMDDFNRAAIREFRSNQGKVGGQLERMALLLLTTKGARTGRSLTRPLAYSRDGKRLVIIASYGGGPRNPPWYYNLLANPIAEVEVGTEKFEVRATLASGAERQRLYDAQARELPIFANYQRKTKRQIPVLTLTRID
jgi:deazaflavin-dependent oxidoreductase (nitroreductase family)